MSNTNERIIKYTQLVQDVLLVKNADYGDSWRRHGAFGIVVRLFDKLTRLENLLQSRQAPSVNESLQDTAIDIVGYGVLLLIALEDYE